MKLFVYCLAERLDALTEPVTGISGARVEVIGVEGLSALVSEFDEQSTPLTVENALVHANVVQTVFKETTVLPFRFGTVVTEQHLRSYISARGHALEKKLAELNGCVEMSVKIIWNADQPDVEPDFENQGPGTGFLRKKRREILGGEHRAEQAKDVAGWLQEQVGALVRREEVSLCPTGKLILAAAHLIQREGIEQYRAQLAKARKIRPELHFLVSGPWPPYSFSNIDLEFKTQFGVS